MAMLHTSELKSRAEDEKKKSWMDKRMEELMPELVGLVLVELLVLSTAMTLLHVVCTTWMTRSL
jgi:uncharacterized membrane protein